jgi:hypothetical protein
VVSMTEPCGRILGSLDRSHTYITINNTETLNSVFVQYSVLGGFPVTTAWCVLGLRMEERPPAMEGSCEYIE